MTEPPAVGRVPAGTLTGLRTVRDTDSPALVTLIGNVFAEYPGCVLDLPGLDADLLTPVRTVATGGGAWWVLPSGDNRLAATIGCGPLLDDGSAELKRLYVAADHRRQGLGRALVDHVERHARRLGAASMQLWSDTRFVDAHRLYERCGYRPTGETRELNDPSDTTEYRFARPL